jgi:SAM-dependent methyltransferase
MAQESAPSPAAIEIAQNYADNRPRYPQRLIDDLRKRTVGDRGERLVDLGCGTGELSLRLGRFFDRVAAVDVSAAMIAVGRARARRDGIENIEWHVDRAENLEIAMDSCDLIVAGSSFHWMDRELLATRAFRGLRRGGALAIVGGAGGKRTGWRELAAECAEKHLGRGRPARKQAGAASHDVLAAAGFLVERFEYPTDFSWRVDEVAGCMYALTGALHALGDRRDVFERDFEEALYRANPSGVVHERIEFFLQVAGKP